MVNRFWSASLALCALTGIGWLTAAPSFAQLPLEADNTLGNEASTIIPLQPGNFQIGGGSQRGSNLFHSFREFNVNAGGSVYFQNPTAIDNILGRVTGDNISNILGNLGVLGDANLFLLNPNGFVFGENARLDLRGSFLASTADQFTFANGTTFSASNPAAPPLLTLSITPGLQYGVNAASGNIVNQGSLYAPQNLTLAANNLNLQGQLWAGGDLALQARDTLQIRDRPTVPFIAASQGRMLVQGNEAVDIFALSHPDSGLWSGGDMTLRSANQVRGDAHYSTGGNFRIEQLDRSLGNLYSPYDPIIRSLGDVSFDAYQGTSLHILAAGDVTVSNYIQILGVPGPGEEAIVDPNYRLSNGSLFPINGFAEPTLDIRAGVDPDVIGVNQLPTSGDFFGTLVLEPPPVDSANIQVGTILLGLVASQDLPPDFLRGRVLLTNQYAPDSDNLVPGNIRIFDTQVNLPNNPDLAGVAIRAESQEGGGFVALDSRGGIALEGRVNANAVATGTTPDGRLTFTTDGGNVTVLANGSIDLRPNPGIGLPNNINSSGRLGGSITVLSRRGNITLVGPSSNQLSAGLASVSFGTAPGQRGGDIRVTASAGNIRVRNGANVVTSTFGQANAGDIFLETGPNGQIEVSGDSQIRGLVEQGGVGRSADLTITTGQLIVDRSQIGGGLFREVTENIVDPTTGNIIALAGPGGRGTSGTITINASDAVVLRGTNSRGFSSGLFSAAGRGSSGPAGNIRITAGNRVVIQDGAAISSLSSNTSSSGNVTITTDDFLMRTGGRIVSTSRQGGEAGTVTVRANDRILITGEDPNYQNRLARINDYLENDLFGQNDTLEDVLGLRADELDNEAASGIFVNASEAATSGDLILNGGSVAIADDAEVITTSNNTNTSGFSNLIITAQEGSLVIDGGSRVSSSNFGTGFAGDVTLNAADRVRIDNGAGVFSQGQLGRIFIGANVQGTAVPPRQVIIGDRASIVTTNANDSLAGDIVITARDLVSIVGDASSDRDETSIRSNGNFGRIAIGQPIESAPGSFSRLTSVSPTQVRIENALISTDNDPDPDATNDIFGSAGNISIRAIETIDILNSEITSETFGSEDAGSISFLAGNRVHVANSSVVQSSTRADTTGDAGEITIGANFILLSNRAELSTATSGTGDAGDISFLAGRNVILSGDALVFSNVNEDAGTTGDPAQGGTILIDGRLLAMSEGAQIQVQVNPDAVGSGGNVFIRSDRLVMQGENNDDTGTAIFSSIQERAIGQGGNIFIGDPIFNGRGEAIGVRPIDQVSLTNGAQFLAQTDGIRGSNAGRVFVIARDISFDGVARVTLADRSVVNRSSAAFTRVGQDARGNGGVVLLGGGLVFNADGDITVVRPADSISLTNGGRIFAETLGFGNAGLVFAVGDRISLSGTRGNNQSAILTLVGERARGTGGNVLLGGRVRFDDQGNLVFVEPAESISLLEGAQIRAETDGRTRDSNAGLVQLVADQITLSGVGENEPSGILTRVGRTSPGSGGAIFLYGGLSSLSQNNFALRAAESIDITGGAQLQSQTAGFGNAGNVYLLGDDIRLDGFVNGLPSAIFSGVDGGTGQGGDIYVSGSGTFRNTSFVSNAPVEEFSISDGAVLSVSSFGLRSIGRGETVTPDRVAGNIFVHARTLDMSNDRVNIGLGNERGIFAETGEGDSGNIDLDIDQLLLLRGSTRISTTAGTLERPGNGGNITIITDDEGFVVAEPFGNNDITSNSFEGAGGRVEITAQQILGLFFRSSEDLKRLLETADPRELDTERLQSSDVTAISQTDSTLDGQVVFNLEGVDPTQGLIELPTGLVDAADQIGQVCPTGPRAAERLGRFVVTGRGGIAPSPLEVLDESQVSTDWLEEGDRSPTPVEPGDSDPSSDSSTLIEADGWVIGSNGAVQLVAQLPTNPDIGHPEACP